jgi:hypothetical protein
LLESDQWEDFRQFLLQIFETSTRFLVSFPRKRWLFQDSATQV